MTTEEKNTKTYAVYAVFTVSKYIGDVEASSMEDAEDKASDKLSAQAETNVCHQCVTKLGGDQPNFDKFYLEESP